jgi:uncharacterized protein DUF2442
MADRPNYHTQYRVVDLEILRPYQIRVRFKDGFERIVDMKDRLTRGVFLPLRDPDFFMSGSFNRDWGTVEWPNGADLAPEFLRWGDDPPADLYTPSPDPASTGD